ncbi:MAG: sugar transferase [Ruminococcus sp.]|nr:sugar transferase [Ruminococcus sp.]
MSAAKMSAQKVSEEDVTAYNVKEWEKKSAGIQDYPILEFDDNSLGKLSRGIRETLKHSKVRISGGKCYEMTKRLFDIVAASLGIAVSIIPVSVFAAAIYLEDKGNPIFTQVRLTKDGKPFVMYKLRSMCMDAEAKFAEMVDENESDGKAFKSKDDKRVTKVGKFIRSTSIDELPQLFNVLKGDMSIIGPRPPLPREVVMYTPHEMERLLVKGGLACVCQCEGRSNMSFNKWVDSDVDYIKHRSLVFDTKLIGKTIIAVLKRDGAE